MEVDVVEACDVNRREKCDKELFGGKPKGGRSLHGR
jgi:hypothetical protein